MYLDTHKLGRDVELGFLNGGREVDSFANQRFSINIKFIKDEKDELTGFVINRKIKIKFGRDELNKGRTPSRLFELAIFYLNNYYLSERFFSYLTKLFKDPISGNPVFEKTTPYNERFKLTVFDGEAKFGISRNGLDDNAGYCTCVLGDVLEMDRFCHTVAYMIRSSEMTYTHQYKDGHYVDELLNKEGSFLITDKVINMVKEPAFVEETEETDKDETPVRCTFCEHEFPRFMAPTFDDNSLNGVYICPDCCINMMVGLTNMFKDTFNKQRKDFFKKG